MHVEIVNGCNRVAKNTKPYSVINRQDSAIIKFYIAIRWLSEMPVKYAKRHGSASSRRLCERKK